MMSNVLPVRDLAEKCSPSGNVYGQQDPRLFCPGPSGYAEGCNRKSCGAPVVIGNPDHVVQARVRVPLIIGKQITSSFA